MDVKFFVLDIKGGTSYVELPVNHRSIINVKKDSYRAIWYFSALLYPPTAIVSSTTSFLKYLNTISINGP